MQKELPIGWIETKLGVIAEWGSGGTPNRSEPNYYNGTIPWVKTGDLNDSIIFEASEYITELGLKKSSAKLFPKGSIIVAMYGATIGKTAKLGIDATTNQACAVAQASKIVIPEFLHYFLKSEKQEFIEKGKGGAQPNISQTVIKDHPFPLPPLPEQQRIVAKLDMLFGHLDALKTRLDRIPQLLKDFRQKVLTQAVTGKLTEKWREGKKLEGIELKKDKYEIEFEFLESYDFPKTWNYIALGNYAECSRGKFTARPRNDPQFFDGEYPFMQIGDLPSNGGLFYSYSSTLNEKGKSVSKCFPKGTVVIAIVGATIGNTGILEKEVFFPDSLIGINSENAFSNFYIEYFLRCIKYKIRELSYAGGGQPNIKLPNITNLGISIPPIEEQQEIVRSVESLFAKADQIEASYQKLKAKIEQLPQALLAKAFRGELVAQLPTDLPAGSDGEFFAYVLYCSDGSLYKGFTNNLKRRYEEHKTGKGAEHTSKYKPLYVYHYDVFKSEAEAVKREKFLKSGHGREWLKQMEKENRLRQAGGDARELLEEIKKAKGGK